MSKDYQRPVEPDENLRHRITHFLVTLSFYLELVIAIFVIVLIFYGIVSLLAAFSKDAPRITNLTLFSTYLEKALNIVIGIEFLKMLCRHSMSSVVEVIMFYLSRQLIVEENTLLEGLFCVIAVAGLFAIRKFLFIPKVDDPALDSTPSPLVFIRKRGGGKKHGDRPNPNKNPGGTENS